MSLSVSSLLKHREDDFDATADESDSFGDSMSAVLIIVRSFFDVASLAKEMSEHERRETGRMIHRRTRDDYLKKSDEYRAKAEDHRQRAREALMDGKPGTTVTETGKSLGYEVNSHKMKGEAARCDEDIRRIKRVKPERGIVQEVKEEGGPGTLLPAVLEILRNGFMIFRK
jgi:hypothetical protein